MAQFVITCDHTAEQCEELDREMREVGVADVIRGRDFLCSCPYGHHGGWVLVEGSDAGSIRESLPPVFRSHASVHQIESVHFS